MRAIVIIAVISAPAAASPCPVGGLEARVMTPAGAVIEDGGGIIVTAVTGGSYDPRPHDVLRPPTWRLVEGDGGSEADDRRAGRVAAGSIDSIAPGLVVYRVPTVTGDAGAVSLVDGAQTLLTVRRSADRDASLLPAPMPTSSDWSRQLGFRDMQQDRVVVHLVGAAPRGAVAVIAYGADGKARSWGPVQPSSADAVVFASPGRCQFLPDGVVEPQPGDRITVAWLDASGRLSARSAPVVVKRER